MFNLAKLLGGTHLPTFLVGLTSLLCMVLLKQHPRTRKLPGFLFVVVLAVAIIAIVDSVVDKRWREGNNQYLVPFSVYGSDVRTHTFQNTLAIRAQEGLGRTAPGRRRPTSS